jgi:hypothetical protein
MTIDAQRVYPNPNTHFTATATAHDAIFSIVPYLRAGQGQV